jgi:hypothetical protein
MKKHEHHLARALENLVGAAESFASEVSRRDPAASAEWRREYGFKLALEYAKRTLARHNDVARRVPADVLLGIVERGRDNWFEAL